MPKKPQKKIKEGDLKSILTSLFLFVAVSNAFAQKAKEDSVKPTNLEVVVGLFSQIKLDFAADRKGIQNSNSSVLDLTFVPAKREITLTGLKPGKSSVIIRNQVGDVKKIYNVTVTSDSLSKTVQELRQFLGDVEGIEIGIKGGKVVVEGKLVVPRDIGRVVVILEQYKDVIRLVELSPQTQRVISKKMQDEIQKAGMKDVTVRIVNGVFWLEGVVTQGGQKALALKIAEGYLPDRFADLAEQSESIDKVPRPLIQNFITENFKKQPAPEDKLLKIVSQFVELKKDYQKIFGFKWTPTISTGGGSIVFGKTEDGEVTTRSQGTLSGTISNLFPKLASAKNAGYARVVQSGMVVVKDGVKATINKTNTTPFTLGTGEFTQAKEATSGFSLDVTPKVLQKENIELSMGVNVNVTAGTPPQTARNSISTIVVVKSKESAVVGGVVVNETATAFDKDPPFGVDQVDQNTGTPLFSFLRSKSYVTNKSQFVVFVTPEIIDSAATGTDAVKRKFRKRRR